MSWRARRPRLITVEVGSTVLSKQLSFDSSSKPTKGGITENSYSDRDSVHLQVSCKPWLNASDALTDPSGFPLKHGKSKSNSKSAGKHVSWDNLDPCRKRDCASAFREHEISMGPNKSSCGASHTPREVATGGAAEAKDRRVDSLLKLCMLQIVRGPVVGDIDCVPVVLAESMLHAAMGRMTSPELLRYLHSDLRTLDLSVAPRGLHLADALVVAAHKAANLTSLSLPSHTRDADVIAARTRVGGTLFRSLQHLSIRGSLAISETGLGALLSGLAGGLKHLDLSKCALLSEGVLIQFVSCQATTLLTLHLAGCSRLGDGVTKVLPPGLVGLDLAGVWRLTDSGVGEICRRCPALETLDLSGDWHAGGQLSSFGLAKLCALRELKVLVLKHQRNFGELHLSRLKANCPNLKSIQL